MNLHELQKQFQRIRKGCDTPARFDFAEKLLEQNSAEYLDFHYQIIRDTETESGLYDFLCREFRGRRDLGENYLLEKIKSEPNDEIKATVLQMLGAFRNASRSNETADLARNFLTSDNDVLRCRALWVLGWIGGEKDLEQIANSLYNDTNADNRCWAASAMMQLYFKNKNIAPQALQYLKTALETETAPKAQWGIAVAVQEIIGKKLGLSASAHNLPDDEKLQKAIKKAKKLLAEQQ